jgi:DNA-binding IclR family transcriptional regulator
MYRRSEARGATPSVSLQSALAAVRRARENGGVAFAESAVVPEVAAVSAPLPESIGSRRLVVSIGGPIPRMRARRAFIEEELATWLERLPERIRTAAEADPAPARRNRARPAAVRSPSSTRRRAARA